MIIDEYILYQLLLIPSFIYLYFWASMTGMTNIFTISSFVGKKPQTFQPFPFKFAAWKLHLAYLWETVINSLYSSYLNLF